MLRPISSAPVQPPTVVPLNNVLPRVLPFNNVLPRVVPFNNVLPRVRQSLPEQQNTIPFQRPTLNLQQFMPMYSVNHVFHSSGKKQSIEDVINKGENKA